MCARFKNKRKPQYIERSSRVVKKEKVDDELGQPQSLSLLLIVPPSFVCTKPAVHPPRSPSTSASTSYCSHAEGRRGRQKVDSKKRDSEHLDDGSRHGNLAEVNEKGRPRRL
ncbi:unnamed protein product [Haemonchus placei]|uniref:Uncharacterized protein n=1 Tax=Haemonchus placei TaxID=6290 RepID=A0A0N4WXD7_HAEPC|nr:unnamed protein product [Haemonchus placei]